MPSCHDQTKEAVNIDLWHISFNVEPQFIIITVFLFMLCLHEVSVKHECKQGHSVNPAQFFNETIAWFVNAQSD